MLFPPGDFTYSSSQATSEILYRHEKRNLFENLKFEITIAVHKILTYLTSFDRVDSIIIKFGKKKRLLTAEDKQITTDF